MDKLIEKIYNQALVQKIITKKEEKQAMEYF